jgi:hypothetical protein
MARLRYCTGFLLFAAHRRIRHTRREKLPLGASGERRASPTVRPEVLRLRQPAACAKTTLFLLAAAACSKAYIPNTDVEDTSVNRQVIAYCELYRHAMEEKDVGKLLKAMSPGYFGDRGNVSADYDQVRDFLTGDFLKTGAIRYEIRYHRVTFTENSHVYVDYTFAAAWKLPGVKADEWHHKVADNRLDLVRDGDSFKIVAGM